MAATIEVRALGYGYPDGTNALSAIDVQVAAGESVAVIGANGAGKSTLLAALVGLIAPTTGSVRIDELIVSAHTRDEIFRRVGYVFQEADNQLFMPTVREDVAFGPHNLGLTAAEALRRGLDALARVGAAHLADRAPYHLSGGEKRLVALAGVLAMAPRAVLFDEPTAGLDAAARRRFLHLFTGLTETRVIATHDLDFVLDSCTRTLVLHQGRLRADGPTQEILADDALLADCHLEPPLRWQGHPSDRR